MCGVGNDMRSRCCRLQEARRLLVKKVTSIRLEAVTNKILLQQSIACNLSAIAAARTTFDRSPLVSIEKIMYRIATRL
jgi:hypothetical protein